MVIFIVVSFNSSLLLFNCIYVYELDNEASARLSGFDGITNNHNNYFDTFARQLC